MFNKSNKKSWWYETTFCLTSSWLVRFPPSLLVAPGPINPSQGCYPNAPRKEGMIKWGESGKTWHMDAHGNFWRAGSTPPANSKTLLGANLPDHWRCDFQRKNDRLWSWCWFGRDHLPLTSNENEDEEQGGGGQWPWRLWGGGSIWCLHLLNFTRSLLRPTLHMNNLMLRKGFGKGLFNWSCADTGSLKAKAAFWNKNWCLQCSTCGGQARHAAGFPPFVHLLQEAKLMSSFSCWNSHL